MPDNNSIQFHDQLALNWENKQKKCSIQNRIRAFESLVREIRFNNSVHWLDAGCGNGYFSRWLAGKGSQVAGVDASREMIQRAMSLTDRESQAGSRIRFEVIDDILCLNYPECSFDGIICLSVLEYLERPDDVLRKFQRLLKTDGYLIISVPNRRAIFRMMERWLISGFKSGKASRQLYLEYSKHWYSKREIVSLLDASGFESKETRYAGMPLPFILDNTVLIGSLIFVLAKKSEWIFTPIVRIYNHPA